MNRASFIKSLLCAVALAPILCRFNMEIATPKRPPTADAMMRYFGDMFPNCSEHELIQMVWMVDMEHYRITGKSITGSDYIKTAEGVAFA